MERAAAREYWVSAMARKPPIGRSVGSFVPGLAQKALQKFGFPAAAILTEWPMIVGPDIAAYTAPERLRWPNRPPPEADETDQEPWHGAEGATLVLRVEGPRALELQHRIAQLIERINAHFGFQAITGIRILQAPVSKPKRPTARLRSGPPPRVAIPASEVADNKLRDVLERLGGNVKLHPAPKDPAGKF